MQYLFKKRKNQDDQGVASIEFSLLFPVLFIMFSGLFDVSKFVYCYNKMYNTAHQVNNIVTREDVTKPQLDAMLQAAVIIAQPFDFTKYGNVIVTSVSHPDSDPTKPSQMMWQASYPGGAGQSLINPGSLPGGLTLNPNETVIFTEVFYTFQPVFLGYSLASNTKIYAVAAGVPRQGTMTTLPAQ